MIKQIVEAVTIPVMAKVRIGHFVEAQVNIFLSPERQYYLVYNASLYVQILQSIGIDYIDESEVLTPAGTFSLPRSRSLRNC